MRLLYAQNILKGLYQLTINHHLLNFNFGWYIALQIVSLYFALPSYCAHHLLNTVYTYFFSVLQTYYRKSMSECVLVLYFKYELFKGLSDHSVGITRVLFAQGGNHYDIFY